MKTNTTRRRFLKAALAATVLPTVAVNSRAVHAAGSDVIKIALIGTGGRGLGAVLNRFTVGDNVKLVAVADVNEKRAREAVESLKEDPKTKDRIDVPADRVFGGFNGYKGAVEHADLVFVASPPAFHPDHYLYAVEHGKHVFVEKPFGVDAEGYRRSQKANKIAEEKGLTVLSGFQRRHQKQYHDWFAKINEGYIGDIVEARVYWNGAGAKVRGVRDKGESEISFQVRDWYFFDWLSGDHLVEQHCHNVDVGNWLFGNGDPQVHPVSAIGLGGRQYRNIKHVPYNECGNIFDHHYIEFTYPDGRILHSQCRQIPGCWNRVTERVTGTKGFGETGWLQQRGGEKWNTPKLGKGGDNGYELEHAAQTDAIRNGKKLHEGWSAATSTMVGILGTYASHSGREITWDDAVSKGRTRFPYDVELTFDTPSPVLPQDGSYEHLVPVPGQWEPFDKT
ncbi:MAG: Gfo/Idh/MocA family oxidoreductase [Planctomycetaceae bacterium]|nr:Gfo/Idh/MocA family oxidoreductase [Planctomycetaceae bacterium]